ncbi:MAG: CRISPR-associated helicase Cas3' [Clostridia bacterium]|nr:CRISPR-associated helicase Cas3' [Clostridia bacterium]
MIDCIDMSGFSPLMKTLQNNPDAIHYDEAVDHFSRDICPLSQLDELFEQAVIEVKRMIECFPKGKDQAFVCGMIARLLLGVLVDADRYDAACFERDEDPFGSEPPSADWAQLLECLNGHLNGFPRDTRIDFLRKSVSDDCLACAYKPGRLYRLTVPTGGGKTLSSLRFALARAMRDKLDRIIYVIPFNTILDQNARDIREALGGYDGILEHHANLVIEDEDECRRHTRLTERWQTPIILTSVVQFLNAIYRCENTNARRMPSMINSVIIFDEIQALPPKCIRLFEMAVKFLTNCLGCTVVLCTATQPALNLEATEMVSNAGHLFEQLDRTRFHDQTRHARSMKQAARDAVSLQAEYGAALVIVNMRSQAAFIFDSARSMVSKDVLLVHLTTDMCARHRMDALDRVKRALRDGNPVLCVSTSLIEAGINISFPCVVRFYAGLPSILQSAGRCNRHGELPEGKKGEVYIWKIEDEHIRYIPHVAIGQRCTDYALSLLAEESTRLDAPEVVSGYFGKERGECKDLLDYPLDGSSLYSLLSTNRTGRNAASHIIENPAAELVLCQAFKTAGKAFHVIDDNTRSIVVPYAQAASLLDRLNSRHDIYEEYSILRRLQGYTVNVYANKYDKLQEMGAIYQLGETGVTVLRDEFYDMDLGLKLTAGEMPLYD